MSRRACLHGGPFRVVAGARDGHGGGEIGVMCMGCGAFQRPYPWTEEPGARPVPWYGEAVDVSKTPEGGGYALLSEPLEDRREAHRVAFEVEKARAEERHDAGWFIQRGLLPSFWEVKRDEHTGDLLYREAVKAPPVDLTNNTTHGETMTPDAPPSQPRPRVRLALVPPPPGDDRATVPEPSRRAPAPPAWPVTGARALLLHHVAAELGTGRCRGGERHPLLDEAGEAEITDTLTGLALGVGDRETFRDVAGQNIGLSSEETDAAEALAVALGAEDPSHAAVLDALERSPRLRFALGRLTPDARALAVQVAIDGAEGDAYQIVAAVRAIAAFMVAFGAGATR